MTKKDIIMAKIAELLEQMEGGDDDVDIVAFLPKMTKEELVRYLVRNYKNCVGAVDLSGLDFSMFARTHVNLSNMKVQGDLTTSCAKVSGSINQDRQEAEFIEQSGCIASWSIYQGFQQADCGIEQGHNKCKDYIHQDFQEAKQIYQDGHEANLIIQNRLDQVEAYGETILEKPGYIFKPNYMTKAACYAYRYRIDDKEQEKY